MSVVTEDVRAHAAESAAEQPLLAALRGGDEAAFGQLVRRYHASMVRLAMAYVPSRAVAEEVAQDTWLAVLQQLDRFEARSTLRTWIFHILVNQAKTRGARERRSVPFSAIPDPREPSERAVPPERFLDDDHRWAGHWAQPPQTWRELPEEWLLSGEFAAQLRRALDALPASQRAVVVLRDVQGLSSAEVCDLLGVTEGNQRVLLHRGRSRVRAGLESYVERERVAV